MTVYFVYRSPYDGPMGLYRKQFQEATVLDWFQNHWHAIRHDDGAHDQAIRILGTSVCGFASLFDAIAEHNLPPPRSERQLVILLKEHLYLARHRGRAASAPDADRRR